MLSRKTVHWRYRWNNFIMSKKI